MVKSITLNINNSFVVVRVVDSIAENPQAIGKTDLKRNVISIHKDYKTKTNIAHELTHWFFDKPEVIEKLLKADIEIRAVDISRKMNLIFVNMWLIYNEINKD